MTKNQPAYEVKPFPQICIREYLNVTLDFDHDIVDGAPAARFGQRFRELVESGHGLQTACR